MKIRERLALVFALSTACILLVTCLAIYYSISATEYYGKIQLVNLRNTLITSFFLAILVAYLIGRYSARLILKPIAAKISKARKINASNRHLRLSVYNEKDEMGQLAITFNEMLDRLDTSFEMQRNFISNASHEIRNPLTAIIGETEVCLEKRRSVEDYIDSLRNISREADRLDSLVNNLLNLTKAGFEETELRNQEVRIDEVLLEAKATIDKTNRNNKIVLDLSMLPENAELICFTGNKNLLHVALTNLMENACKFSGNNEVLVSLNASDNQIQVNIHDKGVGIPEDEMDKIFQPFYRAKNARTFKGFGIGLALTDKIIRLHHGVMQISSKEGKGTDIRIIFPAHTN